MAISLIDGNITPTWLRYKIQDLNTGRIYETTIEMSEFFRKPLITCAREGIESPEKRFWYIYDRIKTQFDDFLSDRDKIWIIWRLIVRIS